MTGFIFGTVIVAALVLGWNLFLRAAPEELAAALRKIIPFALLALAVLFAARGLVFIAAGLAVYALFWFRRNARPSVGSGRGVGAIGGSGPGERWRAPPDPRRMSRGEALEVLGLEDGASDDDIRAAHRRLIKQNHPDVGGSDWLAARINAAKRALLGE